MFTIPSPPPAIAPYQVPVESPVAASSQQVKPAIYRESPNDGIYMTKQGKVVVGKNSPYEISEFSIIEKEGMITFQIESNLPLKGLSEPRAKAKRIGYGDLLLYYQNTTAGIRFSGKQPGIYHNVRAVNNAKFHFGNKTTKEYIKRLKSANAYDSNMMFPPEWTTHIKTGSLFSQNVKVTEVKKNNHYVIAITMPRNQLPEGNFVAYLPTECINDYVMGSYPLTGDTQIQEEEGKNAKKNLQEVKPKLDFPGAIDSPQFLASNLLTPEMLTGIGTAGMSVPAIAGISSLLAAVGALWGDSSGSDGSENPVNGYTITEPVASAPSTPKPPSIDPPIISFNVPSPELPVTPDVPVSLDPPIIDPNVPSLEPPLMPSVPDQAVPEPSTILGVGLSIGFGIIFKRKSNQARKKDDDDNQE